MTRHGKAIAFLSPPARGRSRYDQLMAEAATTAGLPVATPGFRVNPLCYSPEAFGAADRLQSAKTTNGRDEE